MTVFVCMEEEISSQKFQLYVAFSISHLFIQLFIYFYWKKIVTGLFYSALALLILRNEKRGTFEK